MIRKLKFLTEVNTFLMFYIGIVIKCSLRKKTDNAYEIIEGGL